MLDSVTVEISIDELTPYRRNPRVGNVEKLAESLNINGQYRPIVVNKGTKTGVRNEILAGNHLAQAAKQIGWDTIKAFLIDVDEKQAARIIASDNRLADLGDYDQDILLELLEEIDDLTGTGYSDVDIEKMLADAQPYGEDIDVSQFQPVQPGENGNRLDVKKPRLCQKCGYDVANDPENLTYD